MNTARQALRTPNPSRKGEWGGSEGADGRCRQVPGQSSAAVRDVEGVYRLRRRKHFRQLPGEGEPEYFRWALCKIATRSSVPGFSSCSSHEGSIRWNSGGHLLFCISSFGGYVDFLSTAPQGEQNINSTLKQNTGHPYRVFQQIPKTNSSAER